MLDDFYITVFNHYKKSLGKRSLVLALFYINLLESSIILVLGAFFLAFAKQLKLSTMSSTKFWVLFSLVAFITIFKNWMRYNGKRRTVLNAKVKGKSHSIVLLWLLPLGCLSLALILLQLL